MVPGSTADQLYERFLPELNLFTVDRAVGVQVILRETSEYCMDISYGAVSKIELI